MRLSNNTILITGGSRGIGLEFAKQLNLLGNKIIVTGRNLEALNQIKKEHPSIDTIQCDIRDKKAINELYDQVTSLYPQLNVVINNAGVGRVIDFKDTHTLNALSEEIDTNLQAPIHITNLFLRHLRRKEKAAVINVSSALAYAPLPLTPIYSATKAALHSFTVSLRVQLRSTDVKVIEVVPPTTKTQMINGLGLDRLKGLEIMTTEDLVRQSLNAISRGEEEISPGRSSRLKFLSRLAPNYLLKKMSGSPGLSA